MTNFSGISDKERDWTNVDAKESEQLFADYLDQHGLQHQRDFSVGRGDVDFRVRSNSDVVLCDVKEIKKPGQNIQGQLWAYRNIRNDIKKLRAKFGKNRTKEPCILVSMNFSSKLFTGFTVARAMLGDVGVEFDMKTKQIISDLHHLPRGNARMTEQQNRTISGVLVFDRVHERHCLFINPFGEHPVPDRFFPAVQVVPLTRESAGSKLMDLSSLMF